MTSESSAEDDYLNLLKIIHALKKSSLLALLVVNKGVN